jgi:hypothetical protein
VTIHTQVGRLEEATGLGRSHSADRVDYHNPLLAEAVDRVVGFDMDIGTAGHLAVEGVDRVPHLAAAEEGGSSKFDDNAFRSTAWKCAIESTDARLDCWLRGVQREKRGCLFGAMKGYPNAGHVKSV